MLSWFAADEVSVSFHKEMSSRAEMIAGCNS